MKVHLLDGTYELFRLVCRRGVEFVTAEKLSGAAA
jgi:hypothetical protein